MFSRTQNYPALVYIQVDWLVGEDRQSAVDNKMESSEYSYSVQKNNHGQAVWIEIFL